jgi:hypothetical protein
LRNFNHAVASATALATAFFLAIGFPRIANAADPAPAAPAAPTPPPRPVDFDKNSALILIRTSIIALQQANQTGNYSVLYALSAPGFQKLNSPERLSQIFANLRGKKFDLSGILVLEPQLTLLPVVYSNGTLRMAGFFPSVPIQVYFDLQFAPVQGQWRLVAIAVDVGGTTPVAPTPNPALASSYSPPPDPAPVTAVAPTPTPTPSPTPSQPSVEVDTGVKKAKPAPRKTSTPVRQSLGRSSPIDH